MKKEADAWRARGNGYLAISSYEKALSCFKKAIDIDSNISVPFYNYESLQSFLLHEGNKIIFSTSQVELRKSETIQDSYQRLSDSNLALIQEIEKYAEEKPCPKCNEIDVEILSFSPNARSIFVRCVYCSNEYRIKMAPENSETIINLFDACKQNIGGVGLNSFPIWHISIDRSKKTNKREVIPSEVKKIVWKRDGGKCVFCGSEKDLEFDHIIPFSKGGSSTTENIQILCKKCNRKKRALIT